MELYAQHLQAHLQAVEEALPGYLPASGGLQAVVEEAMGYACAAGGKRLRPVLLLEFCRICGGQTAQAMPFACALEMIHSYSLVHDDMPCMDDSPLRRGRPSVHAAYGEDMALLAGDALLNRAFETMLSPANTQGLPPQTVLRAAFVLADAAGIRGMVGGQTIDLQYEHRQADLAVLEQLQEGKTAALMIAACEMGALLGGGPPEQIEAARRFGRETGLCFQIVDDILDVTSSAQTLGKPTGGDAALAKNTYVSLLGLEGARRLAGQRTREALAALEVFGDAAQELRGLAAALLERKK